MNQQWHQLICSRVVWHSAMYSKFLIPPKGTKQSSYRLQRKPNRSAAIRKLSNDCQCRKVLALTGYSGSSLFMYNWGPTMFPTHSQKKSRNIEVALCVFPYTLEVTKERAKGMLALKAPVKRKPPYKLQSWSRGSVYIMTIPARLCNG